MIRLITVREVSWKARDGLVTSCVLPWEPLLSDSVGEYKKTEKTSVRACAPNSH